MNWGSGTWFQAGPAVSVALSAQGISTIVQGTGGRSAGRYEFTDCSQPPVRFCFLCPFFFRVLRLIGLNYGCIASLPGLC